MCGLDLVAIRQINCERFDRDAFVGDICALHDEDGGSASVRNGLIGSNSYCIEILRHWGAKYRVGRHGKRRCLRPL
jgi:hypothetical protein